jgi:hypothetical protein
MTLEAFYGHRFFDGESVLNKKELTPSNREIKMLSMFEQSHQSLIMAAIEHKRKFPHERLIPKLQYAH